MGFVFEPDTEDTRKALNNIARHNMITRLYGDILVDMMICDIEGWDKLEYINELRALLNGLGKREVKKK